MASAPIGIGTPRLFTSRLLRTRTSDFGGPPLTSFGPGAAGIGAFFRPSVEQHLFRNEQRRTLEA